MYIGTCRCRCIGACGYMYICIYRCMCISMCTWGVGHPKRNDARACSLDGTSEQALARYGGWLGKTCRMQVEHMGQALLHLPGFQGVWMHSELIRNMSGGSDMSSSGRRELLHRRPWLDDLPVVMAWVCEHTQVCAQKHTKSKCWL